MNTLNTPLVSSLLSRLFAEAETADAPLAARFANLTPEERAAFMRRANSDYRAFYRGDAKEMYLPVSPETGTLIYMLARASRARQVVEFGTSFGISTVHLAAAVKDNGGGKVIGSEFEPTKARRARENLAEAGLAELAEIREGDALESLARDLPESVDFVLLDGAKSLYPRVLALLEPHLSATALIVADNADDSPEYLAHVRAAGSGYLSVPFTDRVELSMRAR